MWWDGIKTVQVYLSPRLSMAKMPNGALLQHKRPATLPLQAALSQLDAHVQSQGFSLSGANLHVVLQSSLCCGVTVSAAAESEKSIEDSRAKAADLLHQPVEQVLLAQVNPSWISAAMNIGMFNVISNWATQLTATLIHTQPLWAVATHAKALQNDGIKAVAVIDSHHISLTIEPNTKNPEGVWLVQGHSGLPSAQDLIHNWLRLYRLDQQELQALVFDENGGAPVLDGIAAWQNHWRLL